MKTDSCRYKSYSGYSVFNGEVRPECCFLWKNRVFFLQPEEQKLKNTEYESEVTGQADRVPGKNAVLFPIAGIMPKMSVGQRKYH